MLRLAASRGTMIDIALIEECSPSVHPTTMQTLIHNESSGNPFAIGVVDMELTNQPTSEDEAIESAKSLMEQGYNISVGLGQINMHNFEGLGLSIETAFDPCNNLQASSAILENCFDRAEEDYSSKQEALQAAFSCYYSNNFTRGFKPDDANGNSYVGRMAINSEQFKIPQIDFTTETLLNANSNNNISQSSNYETANREEIRAIEDTAPDLEKGNTWDVFSDFSN